jgi:hypothetical protein
MPAGTTLCVDLDAPAGAESTGEVVLLTRPQTAVTGVSRLNEKGLAIRYRLTVTPGTSIEPTARLIVLTLVGGT